MWNAKVRCVDTKRSFSGNFIADKIYEIKNGYLVGERMAVLTHSKSIDELNDEFVVGFELVSEELPQPHKSLLKDGDYLVARNGIKNITSLLFNKFISSSGEYLFLNYLSDDLSISTFPELDIMEIFRDGKLIAKRTEKSKEQIELEEIEERLEEIPQAIVKMLNEQTELQKKRSELKERLK